MPESTITQEDLLTADQVAELLHVQRSTILDRLRRGELPGSKLGGKSWLVRRADLRAKLDEMFEEGCR
jgi:excisionase family DNA binding protein